MSAARSWSTNASSCASTAGVRRRTSRRCAVSLSMTENDNPHGSSNVRTEGPSSPFLRRTKFAEKRGDSARRRRRLAGSRSFAPLTRGSPVEPVLTTSSQDGSDLQNAPRPATSRSLAFTRLPSSPLFCSSDARTNSVASGGSEVHASGDGWETHGHCFVPRPRSHPPPPGYRGAVRGERLPRVLSLHRRPPLLHSRKQPQHRTGLRATGTVGGCGGSR